MYPCVSATCIAATRRHFAIIRLQGKPAPLAPHALQSVCVFSGTIPFDAVAESSGHDCGSSLAAVVLFYPSSGSAEATNTSNAGGLPQEPPSSPPCFVTVYINVSARPSLCLPEPLRQVHCGVVMAKVCSARFSIVQVALAAEAAVCPSIHMSGSAGSRGQAIPLRLQGRPSAASERRVQRIRAASGVGSAHGHLRVHAVLCLFSCLPCYVLPSRPLCPCFASRFSLPLASSCSSSPRSYFPRSHGRVVSSPSSLLSEAFRRRFLSFASRRLHPSEVATYSEQQGKPIGAARCWRASPRPRSVQPLLQGSRRRSWQAACVSQAALSRGGRQLPKVAHTRRRSC